MNILEIIKRVKISCGYTSDAELARALKMSPQNFLSQKKTGNIKDSLIVHAIEHGVNIDWIKTGQGAMKSGASISEQQPLYAQNNAIAQHAPDITPHQFSHPTTRTQDLLSKTAAIIESRSLFSDALKSNIEAFSVGLSLQQDLAASRAMLQSHTQIIETQTKLLEEQNTRLNTFEERLRSMEEKKAG